MYLIFEIERALFVGLFMTMLVNGLLTLLEKWGWILKAQYYAKNDFWHKLFSCYFCMSFHLTVILTVPLLIADLNYFYFAVPLMVAGIINLLR